MTEADKYLEKIGVEWLDKIDWNTKKLTTENIQNSIQNQKLIVDTTEKMMRVLFQRAGALRVIDIEKFFEVFNVTEWYQLEWRHLLGDLNVELVGSRKKIYITYKITKKEEEISDYVKEKHPEYELRKLFDKEINVYHYLEQFEETVECFLEKIETEYDIYEKIEKEMRKRVLEYQEGV